MLIKCYLLNHYTFTYFYSYIAKAQYPHQFLLLPLNNSYKETAFRKSITIQLFFITPRGHGAIPRILTHRHTYTHHNPTPIKSQLAAKFCRALYTLASHSAADRCRERTYRAFKVQCASVVNELSIWCVVSRSGRRPSASQRGCLRTVRRKRAW